MPASTRFAQSALWGFDTPTPMPCGITIASNPTRQLGATSLGRTRTSKQSSDKALVFTFCGHPGT